MPGSDGIAESWEQSPDGKTWTFHLHEGITWQDGQPLTADDVVFTYNYIIENEMPVFTDGTKGIIEGRRGRRLHRPARHRQAQGQHPAPLDPDPAEAHLGEDPAQGGGTHVQEHRLPIGSGPFQVVEWKRGSYVRMAANKDYWLGAPEVDELIYIVYNEPEHDGRGPQVRAASTPPTTSRRRSSSKLQSEPGIKAVAFTFFNWDYLSYNCYTGAARSGTRCSRTSAFRVALDYGIDRDKLVAIAYGGEAAPGDDDPAAGQLARPRLPLAAAGRRAAHLRPREGQELLDAAGYKDTDGDGMRDYKGKPIKLRLWALNESIQSQSAGKLIAGWFKRPRARHPVRGRRRGRLQRPHLELRGRHLRARLRHVPLDLVRLRRPRPDAGLASRPRRSRAGTSPAGPARSSTAPTRQQAVAAGRAETRRLIYQCQQAMYAESPQSITVYPRLLQAIDTAELGRLDLQRGRRRPGVLPLREPEELPDGGAGGGGHRRPGRRRRGSGPRPQRPSSIVVIVVIMLVRRSRRAVEEG